VTPELAARNPGTHPVSRHAMRHPTLRALTIALAALFVSACVADGSDPTVAGDFDTPFERAPDDGSDSGSDDTPAPVEKVLDHDYQIQQTGYWCGPAATRIA